MEKFHYYLYGKEFTLETDQKPLVSIYKKHMVDISPRVPETNSQIISIPTLQNYVQKGKRHSGYRCTHSCDPNGSRGQHPVTHHSCQHDHYTYPDECRIPE